MSTSPVNGSSSSSGSNSKDSKVQDAFANVDLKQFLNLMIQELQNQDPLDPTDSKAMLEQINVMHQIATSDKLNDTLESVLLGQNLVSAGNLIGRQVKALGDDNKEFTGLVDRVSVTDGVPKVHSGAQSASLSNIREIVNPTSS